MAKTAEKTPKTSPFAALLRLRPQVLDRKTVLALVGGEKSAKTHEQVARAFGNSPNTVKQSWASAGMPGSEGDYPLVDILLWRLNHLAATEAKRGLSSITDQELKRQLAEEEVRKMRLQADRLEREEQIAEGSLIDRHSVVTAQRALLTALVEHLSGLPDQIAPQLPANLVAQVTETMRGDIHRGLKRFSEQSAKDVLGKHQPGELEPCNA